MPSFLSLLRNFIPRSGRALAFDIKLFFANFTTMRSVPAEINDACVCTKISPLSARGAGTFLTSSLPERALCIICFRREFLT
jgi:hypothetical protein